MTRLHTSAGAGEQAGGLPSGDGDVSARGYSDAMGRRFTIAAAFLAALLLSASAQVAARTDGSQAASIVSVHDGDTITVRVSGRKEKVRLLGIDTPEMNDERPEYREAAVAARDYANSILHGSTVTLRTDPMQSDRDAYGRLLRYVILFDGTDFNETLVRRGYARVYNRFEFVEKSAFKKVEKAARSAHLGIWQLPPGPAREVPELR